MANWALVKDKEIKELHDLLPKSWQNVSGLDLAADDRDFLKSLGWLAVTHRHQHYDSNLYRECGTDHVLADDHVIETLRLAEKDPAPAPLSLAQQKEQFMCELRSARNLRLSQSDWSQLPDVQDLLSPDQKTQWSAYRQALRDLPARYADVDCVSIAVIDWPKSPENSICF